MAQLGVGRADRRRAGADRGCRSGSRRSRGRRTWDASTRLAIDCDEAVHQLRALALDEIQRGAAVEARRAHERRAGDQRADDVVSEAADPEQRRVGEQLDARVETAELVEVPDVPDERAVRVDHALGRARGSRRVDDDHAIGRRDVGLRPRRGAGRRPWRRRRAARRGGARRPPRRRRPATNTWRSAVNGRWSRTRPVG